LNDKATALCTKIERDFLRTLLGGCSTPISALAEIEEDELFFRGNIFSVDGKQKLEAEKILPVYKSDIIGIEAAKELLQNGAQEITYNIRNAAK
jgi:hydroxymethylbilane synthase